MKIEITDEQILCGAWDYLENQMQAASDREYDNGYPDLKQSLGFDYSERLGELVKTRAEKIWSDLVATLRPKGC